MNQETVFHHLSKINQILIFSTFVFFTFFEVFFVIFYAFSCIFFRWLIFPSKHIEIMFSVFKHILNINVEGKLCSQSVFQ